MNAQVSFPSGQECRYDWEPPEENITGGIEGYNLTAYGNCGICRPLGMVNKTTLFSLCTEWIAMGQTCHFEIRTVTADCGFLSDPANVTSILDGKLYMDDDINNYIFVHILITKCVCICTTVYIFTHAPFQIHHPVLLW